MTSLPAFAGMQNAARPVAHQESPSVENLKEQTAERHHPQKLESTWLRLNYRLISTKTVRVKHPDVVFVLARNVYKVHQGSRGFQGSSSRENPEIVREILKIC